jgi:putative transposase
MISRQGWIERPGALPVVRQCELAGVSRSTVYLAAQPAPVDEEDLRLLALIDEEYTRRPFYGSRRMVVFLARRMGRAQLVGWVERSS